MYKILERKDYKEGKTFHTKDGNVPYVKMVGEPSEEEEDFFRGVIEYWRSTQRGLQQIVEISRVILQVEKSNLGTQVDSKYLIATEQFYDVVEKTHLRFEPGNGLMPKFFEFYYDLIRARMANKRPCRLNSYFAFKDIPRAIQFQKEQPKNDPIICRLDVSKCDEIFEADMFWIEEIQDCSADKAIELCEKYWLGEKSKANKIEILLQGEVTFLEKIAWV